MPVRLRFSCPNDQKLDREIETTIVRTPCILYACPNDQKLDREIETSTRLRV